MEIVKNNIIGFDVHNTDMDEQRKILNKCVDHKLRIAIELTTACYGNCMGCALSSDSRRAIDPIFSIEQLKKTYQYLENVVNSNKDLYTTVLNFGVGDYFMLPDEYFEKVCKESREFFDRLHTYRNGFTFTTPMLLRDKDFLPKIEILKKYFHLSETLVEFVIDPIKLKDRYNLYVRNYNYLHSHFPFMDFVINVYDGLTQEHAAEIVKFTKEIKVQNLEVQYAIKNNNSHRVKIDQSKFNDFFEYIYENYDEKIIINSGVNIPYHSGDESMSYYMNKFVNKIINESIHIDHLGNIYPVPSAFGDVILDYRYDFPPIGNINEGLDNRKAVSVMTKYMMDIYKKNKACHSCEYNKECYSSGYVFYNKFNKSGDTCENIGIDYIIGKRRQLE